jgi:O-antigen ligase
MRTVKSALLDGNRAGTRSGTSLTEASGATPRASRPLRPYALPTAPAAVPVTVCWALCAFVFSLLFESLGDNVPLETTQVTAGLLLVVSLCQPRFLFRRPPPSFWLFSFFLYVGLGHAAVAGSAPVLEQVKLHLQLLVVCWICYCAMAEERVARAALLSLVASGALLAILSLLKLTVTTTGQHMPGTSRMATFGLDPNQLAGCVGLAVLSLLALTYDGKRVAGRLRYAMPLLLPLVGVVLIQTGSRGGLLSLVVGLATFALQGQSTAARVRNLAVVLVVLALFGAAAMQSDVFRKRITSSVESGDMALRENSYPISLSLIRERPIAGWGPSLNAAEIGRRLAHPAYPSMDTHNLVLYVFTSTGFLGGVPFMLGIALCGWTAWQARNGPHGILPFALFTALMVADLSVSGLHWKQHWLVIAYTLAAGNHQGATAGLPKLWRRRPIRIVEGAA